MAVILSLDNQNAEFYFKLGQEQLDQGLVYDAILNLIKANEMANKSAYKIQLAEAYYRASNYAQSTNIYVELFFNKRKLPYILAIYRNLLLMGRAADARKFILYALYDFDGMEPGELDMVPEIDEHELQKLLNITETDDIRDAIIDATEAYNEYTINRLRSLVSKSDFDTAIMEAMEIKPSSKLYDSAQEIICLAAHARGDAELAESTARAILSRGHSTVAFGVLASMPARVPKNEIEVKAAEVWEAVKASPEKALDFVKTLSHGIYKDLFNKYLDNAYAAHNCAFGIIAYRMFTSFAEGDTEEGEKCLKRLQMLFPGDFKVRAYTALSDCGYPAHIWDEIRLTGTFLDKDRLDKEFYDIEAANDEEKRPADWIKNMLCAYLMSWDFQDNPAVFVNNALTIYSKAATGLQWFFVGLLADINLSADTKCDLLYGMLMNGWDSYADVMMGDTFIQCPVRFPDPDEFPIMLARVYCEVYIQIISDGEYPEWERLLYIVREIKKIGVKRGMREEALYAAAHYIYEKSLGRDDETPEEYADLYNANSATVKKYIEIYKSILDK